MKITLKNKYTLKIDDFKFKCCIGKNGLRKNKIEGDKCTPRGTFKLGNLYYRKDRVKKPITKLIVKKIERNMGWCNDSKSKFYNKEIKNHYKEVYPLVKKILLEVEEDMIIHLNQELFLRQDLQ